jgi:MFS family permease
VNPLSRPSFRGLLAGQVVSIAGDRFNYLALVSLLTAHAARAGHGPEGVLALLAWAMLAPALVLSPWAGAVVDRLPLVRVLVWTDLARALVVAAIPFAYHASGSSTIVYGLIALAFALNCFFLPARSALPPHLVPAESLAWANALLVLGGVLATLVGTALGGPLVDRFGPAPALWLDALTYLVSVVCLATLLFQGVDGRVPRAPHEARHPLREARAGWAMLSRSAQARAPVVASVMTWVAGGVLHVAGTAHILGGGSKVSGLGFLIAALAVGAALGSWWTLARPRTTHGLALSRGLFGAGIGLALFAAARGNVAMALAAFLTGVFAAPVFFLSETAIQEAVPEGARARVFSARDFLARGAFLLTTALAAPAVARWGTAAPIAATGVLMALLGAVTLLRRRA